jgi:hypothetical protein
VHDAPAPDEVEFRWLRNGDVSVRGRGVAAGVTINSPLVARAVFETYIGSTSVNNKARDALERQLVAMTA